VKYSDSLAAALQSEDGGTVQGNSFLGKYRPAIAASALVLSLVLASSCVSEPGGTTLYVVATSVNASRLQADIASFAQRHGLNASVGHATDDSSHTLRVVEAKGRRVRLWAQNMPLSGREDTAVCGGHPEAYVDPGQYVVTIKSVMPFLGSAAARDIADQMRRELPDLGYEVRGEPIICSALAKSLH
jgi:hypothetical protein